jgi:hypothetical protein
LNSLVTWCYLRNNNWWFGTWVLFFPSYWECHNLNWLIFFRGVETTNQINKVMLMWEKLTVWWFFSFLAIRWTWEIWLLAWVVLKSNMRM